MHKDHLHEKKNWPFLSTFFKVKCPAYVWASFTLKSFSVSILGFFAPGRAGEAGKWSQSCGKSYLSVSRLRERKGLCCVKEARCLLWKKGEIYIFFPNYTDRRRPSQKKRKNIVNQSKFGQHTRWGKTRRKRKVLYSLRFGIDKLTKIGNILDFFLFKVPLPTHQFSINYVMFNYIPHDQEVVTHFI